MCKLFQIALLLIYIVTICSGQSEADCDKYCHKSCVDYMPGREFTLCLKSNVNCECGIHPNARTGTVLIVSGCFVVFVVCPCCFNGCRKKCSSGNHRQFPPVVTHVNSADIVGPRPISGHSASAVITTTYNRQPSTNPYYIEPAAPIANVPPANRNTMQTVGFINQDQPPTYGQAIIMPPESDPPSYIYNTKYNTYK